jgi:hypothetical protein
MKKFINKFIVYLLILVASLFTYIQYILHTPPVTKSFIENFRVVRLSSAIGFYYLNDISNFRYSQLAEQYREDIKDYYKVLSNDEQKLIWQNYLKIYKLQDKINWEIIFYKKQMIIYRFKAKSYDVDAKFTVSYIQCVCKIIKIDFTKQPNIKIDIKDQKLYDFIKINMQKTYEVLEENRKYKK